MTFGTECRVSRRAAFSAAKPAHESVCASWVHNDVNGTDVTMNLKVAVELTYETN